MHSSLDGLLNGSEDVVHYDDGAHVAVRVPVDDDDILQMFDNGELEDIFEEEQHIDRRKLRKVLIEEGEERSFAIRTLPEGSSISVQARSYIEAAQVWGLKNLLTEACKVYVTAEHGSTRVVKVSRKVEGTYDF